MDMKASIRGWDIVERDPFGRIVSMTAWPATVSDLRPYTLLVPVDGSPSSLSAIDVALQLADQKPNAELHVLNIQVVGGSDEWDDQTERQGLLDTQGVRDILAMNEANYQLHIATGIPSKIIHEYARQHNVAEVVMGFHGGNRLQRLMLGSVAMDVAEKLAIPVTFVKSRDHMGKFPAEWVNWLVPCDGSPSALRALRYAISHASGLTSKPKLYLLNIRQHEVASSEKPSAIDRTSQQSVPRNHQTDGARQCDAAFALLEEVQQPFVFRVEVGDPAKKILEAIEYYGCGHVAMGSRGLGVLGGLVLGSVSQSVVQHAGIPVTLVK